MVLSHVASRKAFAVVCLSVVSCLLSVVSCQLSVVKVSPFPREQTLRLCDPTAVDWQCIASCSLNDWSLSILSSRRKYV